MDKNIVELWVEEEFRDGVSAGAAARQLCRTLGCSGEFSKLKQMLEEMLADTNRRSFDRSVILMDFDAVDPEAALKARCASFKRLNPNAPISNEAS